jgi:hypothetical protein
VARARSCALREVGEGERSGNPAAVDGRVWGLISTSSPESPFPERVEERLAEFTELVATAIANGQAREQLARLTEEQAALRRVATLVAEGGHRPRCSKPSASRLLG